MPEEHTNKQKVDQSASFSLTEVKIQVMGNTQECVELVNLMKQRKYLYTYLNDCIRLRKIRLLPQTFCRFTRQTSHSEQFGDFFGWVGGGIFSLCDQFEEVLLPSRSSRRCNDTGVRSAAEHIASCMTQFQMGITSDGEEFLGTAHMTLQLHCLVFLADDRLIDLGVVFVDELRACAQWEIPRWLGNAID
jgi:hypothetical protein